MLVRERMTPNPITIMPDTSVTEALNLIRTRKVRRLPVIDRHGQLVGIVSYTDLLAVSPSPATLLSVWEMRDLLEKLKVDKIMTREVVTVAEDTPVEEAARIMADRRIGGLPVLRDHTVVGIITETDLFKTFLALLGGRRPGVRLAVTIPSNKGSLAKLATAIAEAGGDIVGLGISEPSAATHMQWEITVKVQDVAADKLVEAVRPVSNEVLDVREIQPAPR